MKDLISSLNTGCWKGDFDANFKEHNRNVKGDLMVYIMDAPKKLCSLMDI